MMKHRIRIQKEVAETARNGKEALENVRNF